MRAGQRACAECPRIAGPEMISTRWGARAPYRRRVRKPSTPPATDATETQKQPEPVRRSERESMFFWTYLVITILVALGLIAVGVFRW